MNWISSVRCIRSSVRSSVRWIGYPVKIGYPVSDAAIICQVKAGIGLIRQRPIHKNLILANFWLSHPYPIHDIMNRDSFVQDRISIVRRWYNTTDVSYHCWNKETANTYKSNIGPFPILPSWSYSWHPEAGQFGSRSDIHCQTLL